MAPSKRSAPNDSDDDSDDGQRRARDPSSTPHGSANKRRRTSDESSLARDRGASSDPNEASTPPSDFGSDEGEENEEADFAATQAIEERKHSRKDQHNEPALHGILEEVQLENFMCHDDYKFELGPLINFICGKNGSGKSAILTAIVLCLGGKASATNRGARLQNFIKEGRDHARIVCKIKNQGESAYMPDLYGSTIQVERHFSRTGGSGFKLKSERGRIISTRKSDLEDICDHMILQMENPMTVLSQDQARQFISSSSSAEKYKLFMKGVHLEQLDQDYRIIEEQQENIRAKIEAMRPDLKDLQKKHESARNKQELSRKYDSMLDKLRDYRRQLAWAQVSAKEAVREEYVEQVREADTKIQEAEAHLADIDAVFQESDRAASTAVEAYNEARLAVDRLQEEKEEEKKERHDEIKKETSDAQADQRSIHTALREARETIEAKTQAIAEEEQRLAELSGGGAARRIADLHKAKEASVKAIKAERDHHNQREGRVDDIKRMEGLEIEAQEVASSHRERLRQQKQNLDQLRRNRENADLAFHNNMPALLKALERATDFQERPIGPLGKHVRLLKPNWSSIIEKSFGSALNAFLVTSKRDEKLLSNIMRQTKVQLPIFIVNKQQIDIRAHEPEPRFDTILRVLEIDNELVRKQLVIAHQIEQSILIEDLTEASETLFGGRPLEKVKRCYCFSAGSRLRGACLFYRGTNAAQDPVHEFQGSPRMKSDIEDSIRRQQEAIAEMSEEQRRLEEEHSNARDRHEKAKQALVRHERAVRGFKIAVQTADDEVERLKDEITQDNVEGGALAVLKEALKSAEEQQTLHEHSFEDSVNNLDNLKAKLRESNRKLREFDDRIAEAKEAADGLQARAQEAGQKRAYDLNEKNAASSRVEDGKSDRERLVSNLAELDEQIAAFAEQARNVSERVNIPDGETYESLEKRYKRLFDDYHKYHDRIGDREKIAAEATKWKKAYDNAQKELQSLENLRDKLNETMMQRKFRWKQFRSFISAHAKAQFGYMLSERGFRGRLVMDHRQKLMDLKVEPDITRRDGSGRSARTLSGGEKSFSQICLLLAIWEAMGAPIRCLDEFDVFMDAVNRTVSVNLLIEGARQSIGRQFILISPGNKSDIKRAPDVKAIEVAAPERGQTRLVLASA
ncbi:Structural maintenance of chromosomes protein 6 [Exophiala xenobiotica]|nr:Structural maintenance of chromosomes protein 6 [Exophiala xenobiotica]KAK5381357.1 Structural maintenance of chromosomes protein 6 [Exophiala xenobiotica]KAK5383049.1 Structural maintenance of chromosomes protein 6 [Exophiala xenobiotica]